MIILTVAVCLPQRHEINTPKTAQTQTHGRTENHIFFLFCVRCGLTFRSITLQSGYVCVCVCVFVRVFV